MEWHERAKSLPNEFHEGFTPLLATASGASAKGALPMGLAQSAQNACNSVQTFAVSWKVFLIAIVLTSMIISNLRFFLVWHAGCS
jgi:hypothetical protein